MTIEIKDLCFAYRNSKELAVNQFSMNIETGEVISILGRSGSGKSTVLRILAGLEVPSEGEFTLFGETMFGKSTFVQPEKRGIGLVFQDYALFPHMTVFDNVKFGLSKLSKTDRNKRANEVLELVEMQDYKKRFPHQLSGGQQQRVALARALAPNPKLLLLDEPFSNLDKELQNKIREELYSILKRAQITSIFVTHDEDDAHTIADRIVKLDKGKVTKIGRPCDMLGTPLKRPEVILK
ncbi:ABC transporter ATP-binding protein [Chryseomicrobium palamuruense]|uniref:ABC transporter ATP-binding protein n=1 Tax=Chryseomicrobium palamuruense TaxID=682973 RepID=A0ABV8UYZ1_9BACL